MADINLNGNIFVEITDQEWQTPIWWCEELELQINPSESGGLEFYRGSPGWDSNDPMIWDLQEDLERWEKPTKSDPDPLETYYRDRFPE